MKFTELEVALFENNIYFVHLSPDEEACRVAEMHFESAICGHGLEYLKRDTDYTNFAFGVCKPAGRSLNHVPVLIIENEDKCNPIALKEALHIPHCENGIGPMVIR